MEFNLSKEQKMTALNAVKDSSTTEMYTLLVRMGIDPETFDIDSWVTPSPMITGDQHRLDYLISSLRLVEEKINNLS
jgi:hypothetical protein